MAAAGRGSFVLDGVQRMRERPIQDLVDGLVALGVEAKCLMGTGCPPVEIIAEGLKPGKVTYFPSNLPKHVCKHMLEALQKNGKQGNCMSGPQGIEHADAYTATCLLYVDNV